MIGYFIDTIKLLLTKTYVIMILRTFVSRKRDTFYFYIILGLFTINIINRYLITLNALIILIKTLSQMSTFIFYHCNR